MTIQPLIPRATSSILSARIQALMTDLLDLGFGVKLHSDPEAFARFFRQVEGFDPASPLDPAFCHLNSNNFFWVQILDAHRNTIAMCAGRMIDAPANQGGLVGILRNQRIFGDKAAQLWSPEIEIEGPAAELSGRLGYVGGGWVMPKRKPRTNGAKDKGHPGWRDRGLIGFCVQLVQAHLLENFGANHLIGFVRPHHVDLALSKAGYSFHRTADLRAPYYTGTGFAEPLIFVYSTHADALEHLGGNQRPQFRSDGIAEIPGAPSPLALRKAG